MDNLDRSALDQPSVGRESQTTYILQSFILPDVGRANKLGLYMRPGSGTSCLASSEGLPIDAGDVLDFTSFFNAFSHRKWHEVTGIEDLSLLLTGAGTVEIAVVAYHYTSVGWHVARWTERLSDEVTTLCLPRISDIAGEILGLRLRAVDGNVRLTSASWATVHPPKRTVSLAAIITTFGRAAAVRKAMAMFVARVCVDVGRGSVKLLVVDNEQQLEPSLSPHVTIIHNKNLGGSGGFARGLLEAERCGLFTHALFMDDDAACEPESVWRSMSLLAYCSDARSAVAGAMLLEERPCVQHEKGAALDRTGRKGANWHSNKHGRDLSSLQNLCDNERDDAINYGGWWFFAFSLGAVERMPFPFFVRGDDVDFSIANDFPILTLNGIASWCESFGTKLGPATEYLTYRAWLALALMHGSQKAAQQTFLFCLKTAERFAYRFDYTAMDAVLDALDDVLEGPSSFTNEPAPLKKLASYRAKVSSEEPTASDLACLEPQRWNRFYRFWSRLPFSGHLFPLVSEKARAVCYAKILWDLDREGLGGARKAIVGEGLEVLVLTLDRSRFRDGLDRLRHAKRRVKSLQSVREQYMAQRTSARTREYWIDHLSLLPSPRLQHEDTPQQ